MDALQFLKNLEIAGHRCFSACNPALHVELFEAAGPLFLSDDGLRRYSKEQLMMRIDQLAGELHGVAGGEKILEHAGYANTREQLKNFSRAQLLDFLRGMVIAIADEPCHRSGLIEAVFKFDPLLIRDFRTLFLITIFRPGHPLEYIHLAEAGYAVNDARAVPLLLRLVSAIESTEKDCRYSNDYHCFLRLLGRTGTEEAVAKLDQLLQGEKGDVLMRNGSIGWGGQHPLTLKGVVIKALGDSENELAVRALRKKLESETNHAAREAIQFQLGRLSNTLQEHVKRMPPPPVAAKRNRAPGFRRRRCHPM